MDKLYKYQSSVMMNNTKEIGNIAEQMAVDYLIDNNYEIKDRNFYAKKFGELDIIAVKDNVIHFVEVKGGYDFEAIYNVTSQKLRRLIRSMEYYIQRFHIKIPYCLDIAIVDLKTGEIDYRCNVTI